jgi:choline transport protein
LIYVAIIWLAIAINILASRLLPLFNKLISTLSVFTLAGTTITLFIVSRQNHAPLSSIFADTSTHSGWKSDGFGFMLAVSNAVFAFLGSDCGAHLCEEIHNPSRNVPMVIVFPLIVGLVTAFPFACALMYSVHDLTSVLNSVTGLPLIDIYFQGTNSTVAASVLLSTFAFCFFGCLVANGMIIVRNSQNSKVANYSIPQLLRVLAHFGLYPGMERFHLAKSGCEFTVNSRCRQMPRFSPVHVSL